MWRSFEEEAPPRVGPPPSRSNAPRPCEQDESRIRTNQILAGDPSAVTGIGDEGGRPAPRYSERKDELAMNPFDQEPVLVQNGTLPPPLLKHPAGSFFSDDVTL